MPRNAAPAIRKLLLLPILALLFSSCLTNGEEGQTRDQLVFNITFTNISTPVIVQEDTLEIVSVRFIAGRTTLQNNSGDSLLVIGNPFQISYQRSPIETVGITQGNFDSEAVFNSIAFEIKQAEQSDINGSNIDADAFIEGTSDDQRYSMIINGTFNGEDFTYKSTRNFNLLFPFEDNSGGNQDALIYNIPLESNVENWFINQQDDSLLDPSDPDNASAINNNIEFSVELN